jgi:hypothetical protein
MNKKQINDVVFEALFRQAFIDEFEEEISSIQSEGLAYMCEPSPEFQMRMKKLFENDNRKTLIKNFIIHTKKVAVILFIILGCTFATLLLNKEVQATVNKVIIEIYEKFNSIIFQGEQLSLEEKDWTLNYLPKGYALKKYEKLGNVINIEYEDVQGNKIRFSYRPERNSTNISVDNENHEMKEIKILNEKAYLLTAKDNKFDNGIIWNTEKYRFELWGTITIDELKSMAESITKK